jgi:hypothetical protein
VGDGASLGSPQGRGKEFRPRSGDRGYRGGGKHHSERDEYFDLPSCERGYRGGGYAGKLHALAVADPGGQEWPPYFQPWNWRHFGKRCYRPKSRRGDITRSVVSTLGHALASAATGEKQNGRTSLGK